MWKFKTLSWIPRFDQLNRNLNNINFFSITFSAKINDKFESACKKSAHFITEFVLEIQQISESQAHFWLQPPKIIKVTFGFPKFLSPHQKSVYSINSFLRYCLFYSPETRVVILICHHAHPHIFQSTFNIHESVSTKSSFFITLFMRYCRFKNPAIWFTKSILAHISGNRFFPSMGF